MYRYWSIYYAYRRHGPVDTILFRKYFIPQLLLVVYDRRCFGSFLELQLEGEVMSMSSLVASVGEIAYLAQAICRFRG